jgi:nitroreductase
MNLFEAIRTRRTVRKFNPDKEVPEDCLKEILTAATWAPNHRRQEPWCFYVIRGEARAAFSEVRVNITRADLAHLDPEVAAVRIERARQSILKTPMIIVVTSAHGENEEHRRDNYQAVCASIQNLLLAAHGLGLGAVWRTGRLLDLRVKEFVRAGENETMVGVVYLGYPAADPESDLAVRRPLESRVTWITHTAGKGV